MNKLTSLVRVALVPALMFASCSAYAATITVYPTGVTATDVQNVQTALNQGGSVLLKATTQAGKAQSFNFGTWNASVNFPAGSQVNVVAAVTISGETVGANRTTISGGVSPFFVDAPVKTTITGIKFVNPQCSAITVWGSSGLTISNCAISGVLPFLNGSGYTESSGIYVEGSNNTTIAGPVVISGNSISGLDGQYEFGIQLYGVESSMSIASNSIAMGTATDAAAGQVDAQGISIIHCSGASVVSGNNISIGSGVCYDGIATHGTATGAVTILGNYITIAEAAFCYEGIGINGSSGAVDVLANEIVSDGYYADAIALSGGYNGTVTKATVGLNDIDMSNSAFGAIGLYGAVTNSTISLNLITGEAAYALSTSNDGTPTDLISSNSFFDNLIIGFTATQDTIYLDTNTVNNTVNGPYTTVVNNGTGNKLSHSLF